MLFVFSTTSFSSVSIFSIKAKDPCCPVFVLIFSQSHSPSCLTVQFIACFETQQAFFLICFFSSSVSRCCLSIVVCMMFELAHFIDLTIVNTISKHSMFCHSIGNRFSKSIKWKTKWHVVYCESIIEKFK